MSQTQYILAIDQGTTGTKALIVNQNLDVVAEKIIGFKQHYPKPGWVEHDLNEIWDTTLKAIQEVVSQIDVKKIISIGITNQRETLCFWEKETATPLSHAIVWQDRRTADYCKELKDKGVEPFIQESTGLLLDPYFSGTKANWALKNWDPVKKAHQNGKLCAGTIDSFLIAKLSGGMAHLTEPSNASRTLCYHIKNHEWDTALCSTLDVPKEIWPDVLPSVGKFASTHAVAGLPNGIPITGVLGDQQAALLGQACIQPGEAKCTYGTGAFLLMNTGDTPVKSRHRLLTTIAWALDSKNFTYALEGSAFIAGAAVQWVRDGLGIVKESSQIEQLALTVESSEGVTFVPALTGLGAPYWNPHATGMITGITRGTTAAHIARATLDGIAFQNADLLTSMQKDLGRPLKRLNVDGGASENNLLMQFQSDILGVELFRPKVTETTSMGAIFASGLGIGLWSDLNEIKKAWTEDRKFVPQFDDAKRLSEMERWKNAIKRVNLDCQ